MWTDNRIISQRKGRNLDSTRAQQKGIDQRVCSRMPWRQLIEEDEYAGAYEYSQERNGSKHQGEDDG